MNRKPSLVIGGVLLALSTLADAQTPAPTTKRDLGAEAAGATASSRSVITPEQRQKMQACCGTAQ